MELKVYKNLFNSYSTKITKNKPSIMISHEPINIGKQIFVDFSNSSIHIHKNSDKIYSLVLHEKGKIKKNDSFFKRSKIPVQYS